MKRIGVPVTGARANEEGEARDGKEEDTRIVRIVDGSFEDFSLSGLKPGSVDCVVIAQAWHWCPDYDRAFVSLLRSASSCPNEGFGLGGGLVGGLGGSVGNVEWGR